MRRAAFLALLATLAGTNLANAQFPRIRGYYLNVPTWSDSNLIAVGGLGDINRLRFMTEPTFGDFKLQVAYEQLLSLSQRAGSDPSGVFVGLAPGGGDWLDLQWVIKETDHVNWAHRFDRLNLKWTPSDAIDLVLGRQTISWATTLFLTPADPFIPFDPSDPFRVYRAGVDAFRFQFFPGPLSDLDFVIRPADFSTGETMSVLARGRTVWKSWEVSSWFGMLYDEPAVAVGAAGGIGAIAVRGEAVLQGSEGEAVFRGTVGIDGRIDAWSRDLFYTFEYQRDGFGAASSSELIQVVQSVAFAQGQLQVLGQNEVVAQGSFQIHPLWSLNLLLLTNLDDPSALLSPSASYSISNEVTGSGGLFLGFGDDTPSLQSPIPSEYGLVPGYVYLSVEVFF